MRYVNKKHLELNPLHRLATDIVLINSLLKLDPITKCEF